jgi:hypothetical protein
MIEEQEIVNTDSDNNYITIIDKYNEFVSSNNLNDAVKLVQNYADDILVRGGAPVRTSTIHRQMRQKQRESEYFPSREELRTTEKIRRTESIRSPVDLNLSQQLSEPMNIQIDEETQTKEHLQSELVRLKDNYDQFNYLYFLYYVYYSVDFDNEQLQQQLQYIINDPRIQQIKFDLDLYEEIILNNNLDLFEALSTETNRDYLIDIQHYMNLYNIYNIISDAVTEQTGIGEELMEEQEKPMEETKEYEETIKYPIGLSDIYIPTGTSPAEREQLYKKRKTDDVTLPELSKRGRSEESTQRDIARPRSRNSPSSFITGGASEGEFCGGKMDKNLTLTNPLDINLYSYLVAGLSKTRDELTHDFGGKLNNLSNLVQSYDAVINRFVSELESTIRNDDIEAKKMLDFIKLLQKKNKGDTEWHYYTSSLQIMDSKCDKLNDLNITKIVKLTKYPYLNTTMAEPYIIELQKLATEEGESTSEISTNIELQNKYLYISLSSMNLPIKPIYSIDQLAIRFEDNSVDLAKLRPLVDYIGDLTNFVNMFYSLKYGPGLIDPKTRGKIPFISFSDPKTNIESINIQKQQNINDIVNDVARNIMIHGANLFMGYFGVRKSLVENVSFIIDATNQIEGIRFDIYNESSSLELYIGDTTIANITDFINSSEGLIKVNDFSTDNPSHSRLYNFGKYIFDNIQRDINIMLVNSIKKTLKVDDAVAAQYLLTQIIICLKSFGDSYQVYYSKQFASQTDNNNLYISSTDKNVAGESFLLNNKFLIIGTGIRPHNEYAKEYPEFFYKKKLYNYFKVDESKYKDVADDELDSIITITTNITLKPEDYIKMIIDTYKNIRPYLSDQSLENEQLIISNNTIQNIFTNFNNNTDVFSSNNIRITYQDNLIDKLNNPEDIEIFKEINNYLKTIYDILRLTITGETGETLLETKLNFITDITSTDFINKLNKITKKEATLVFRLSTIKNTLLDLNIQQQYTKLFDENIIDFANKYLNEKYSSIPININERYKTHIQNIIQTIKNKIDILQEKSIIAEGLSRAKRIAAAVTIKKIQITSGSTDKISDKIDGLRVQSERIQREIYQKKENINRLSREIDIPENLEELKTQLNQLSKLQKKQKEKEIKEIRDLIKQLEKAEIELNKTELMIKTNEEKIKKLTTEPSDPKKELYELLLQNQAYFITDLIPKLEVRTFISSQEATSSSLKGGRTKTKKYTKLTKKYTKLTKKYTKLIKNKKNKKTKHNKLQKRRQQKTKKK